MNTVLENLTLRAASAFAVAGDDAWKIDLPL